jgi:hypothetical protein
VTKRWSETQHLVAGYFATHGWPYATPAGMGVGGVDIDNLPGLACEVKSGKLLDLPGFLRQAGTRPGLPFVVYRPQGFGEASLRSWPMILPLMQGVRLLKAAGYGDDDG